MRDHIIINIRDLANLLLAHTSAEKEWIAKNADYIINMCKNRASSNTPFNANKKHPSVSEGAIDSHWLKGRVENSALFTVRFVFDSNTSEDSLQKFVKCWGDLLETIKTKHSGFQLTWQREVKTSGILFWKTESVEFVLTVTWDGAV